MKIVRLVLGACLALVALFLLVPAVLAYDPNITVAVKTWTSDTGHAYVGVQATGQWAPPASSTGSAAPPPYVSTWQNMGNPGPNCHDWWVTVTRTSDGQVMNPGNPVMLVTCGGKAPIGLAPSATGDMSLYLAVSVQPQSAPANQVRTITAQLTAGWLGALSGAIQAYIVPSSVHVTRWTIDFGDGTTQTYPANAILPDEVSTTHRFGPGQFDVVATAHVSGDAYAAFFAPDGTPLERLVPFALDISNRATGIAALAIDYIPPVVTVGASPSGTLPGGTVVAPDTTGHAALWWPRGLPCALYPRAIVVREGFMRSGGFQIGGATTVLTGYTYEAGPNDASAPTPSGTYPAADPIAIQWDTPLPGQGTYPVRLVLDLRTTYADGTVRTETVAGSVAVTVIYSAVGP
ncbi:MAG: hypothetical protein M0Z49_00340 [Chloroflexi bacterium]|nr:hypothetical protein [Chloroflexota bacterium]